MLNLTDKDVTALATVMAAAITFVGVVIGLFVNWRMKAQDRRHAIELQAMGQKQAAELQARLKEVEHANASSLQTKLKELERKNADDLQTRIKELERKNAEEIEHVKKSIAIEVAMAVSRTGIAAQIEVKLFEKELDAYLQTRKLFVESNQIVARYADSVYSFGNNESSAKLQWEAITATNLTRAAAVLIPIDCREAVNGALDAETRALGEIIACCVGHSTNGASEKEILADVLEQRKKAHSNVRDVFSIWQAHLEKRSATITQSIENTLKTQ
jgi:hypothetical protein